MIFDKHSSLTDRTQRSAWAFKFGLRAGKRTVSQPARPPRDPDNPRFLLSFRFFDRTESLSRSQQPITAIVFHSARQTLMVRKASLSETVPRHDAAQGLEILRCDCSRINI